MAIGSQAGLADDDCSLDLIDGEITEHDYSGFHGTIRLYVPPDPPPESGYPVVAYYHGWSTGLKPNLRIMHAVTGGQDYLLIGMSYRSRHFYEELDRKSLRKELSHLDRILDDVAACRPLNMNAFFLAGYSQGGYAVSMLGEQRIDEVAGLVLLGSGRRLHLDGAVQCRHLFPLPTTAQNFMPCWAPRYPWRPGQEPIISRVGPGIKKILNVV